MIDPREFTLDKFKIDKYGIYHVHFIDGVSRNKYRFFTSPRLIESWYTKKYNSNSVHSEDEIMYSLLKEYIVESQIDFWFTDIYKLL